MLYYLVYYYFLIVCTAFFSLSGKEERHKPVAKLCRVIIKSAQSYIKMLIYLRFAPCFLCGKYYRMSVIGVAEQALGDRILNM